MLKSLHLKNFTVFPDANLEFGKQLNVIVGENGLGKTHVLKGRLLRSGGQCPRGQRLREHQSHQSSLANSDCNQATWRVQTR